ncbi:4,5-DOPA dioxygenase extradiol [Corynebacterium sp. H128]|uniref:4,5-DOPA-extradiol-dioxygenase n=1 Tax=unclassified Corynebacterium TaxID=2624378 RepID=UPI003094D444
MSPINALFVGHGSPMNAIEENSFTDGWVGLGREIYNTKKPRAIIAVSAHWYTRGTAVTAMQDPRTIHDFYGFPQKLFDVQYPAPGDPEIAALVQDIAKPTLVQQDYDWGIDHGTWSVLTHMFPQADIPVLQVSVDGTKALNHHMELGAKLAKLAQEKNLLLVGSGNVVHNLGAMNWNAGNTGFDWAERFDKDTMDLMLDDPSALAKLANHQDFAKSVPTPDHFLPLAYIAGAAAEIEGEMKAFNEMRTMGSLSMTGYTLSA